MKETIRSGGTWTTIGECLALALVLVLATVALGVTTTLEVAIVFAVSLCAVLPLAAMSLRLLDRPAEPANVVIRARLLLPSDDETADRR